MKQKRTIEWNGKEPGKLADVLKENGIPMSMPCGGDGRCGRCRVQFLSGAPEAGEADRRHFTKEELSSGWRLGCLAQLAGECRILIPDSEEDMESAVSFAGMPVPALKEGWGIGIDIGTTTIALALVDLSKGEIIKTCTCVNHQRSYGEDVLTRIQKANEGKREELTDCLREDLHQAVEMLLEGYDDRVFKIEAAVAANTVMLHLLLGYSCETLGQAPFVPVSLALLHKEQTISFGGTNKKTAIQVSVFPGISAFVGADIVAGIYMLNMTAHKRPVLLLDLGTNGEMALWTGEKLYVTSAAAGPAFEGGNIKNGVPGIPGAICSVSGERGRIRTETIGDQEPVGICGSGILSAVCVLLELGVLDETGKLAEPYFEEGYPLWIQSQWRQIRIYQEDIRAIQAAKAAIRAGIEILLRQAGVKAKELEKLYLAGGMGATLNPEHASGIGLIPPEAAGCTEAVGNTSLGGTIRYLMSDRGKSRDAALEKAAGEAQVVSLAQQEEFLQQYITYMAFPKR